jgi:hypothetical protein
LRAIESVKHLFRNARFLKSEEMRVTRQRRQARNIYSLRNQFSVQAPLGAIEHSTPKGAKVLYDNRACYKHRAPLELICRKK